MVTHTASVSESYYLEHGFERDPFPPAADDILFQTPENSALVQSLRELIAGNQKTVLVTGPAGAGKSTLAEYLENHPEENWHIKLIQIENDMDRQALAWRMVQLALPEKAPKPAMAIPMLHKYLELSSHAGFVPVFVLDDADRLTNDTLQFVLELATLRYAESLYRFVLFAEQSITKKLADPTLQEQVATGLVIQALPAFSRNQTRDYIELRLKAAGEGGRFSFDDKKIDAIHRITGGLPGPVNTAARKAMQAVLTAAPRVAADMPEEEVSVIEPARRRTGLAAGMAVIVVLGLAGWFYLTMDTSSPVIEPVVIESADETEPANPEPADLAGENSPGTSEAVMTEEPVPAIDAFEVENPVPAPIDDADPVPEVTTSAPIVEAPQPDITGVIIAEASTDTIPGIDPQSPIPNQTTAEVEIAPAVEPVIVDVVADPPAPVSRTYRIDETNIYNLDTVPDPLKGMRGNSWFRQQPRTSYTLQLISASNIDNVLELTDSAPDSRSELSGYVKYTPSGRPRYLMFHGLYPDKESAAAAVSTLPASLQAVNPWPRSIGNITDEIDTVIGNGRP